MYLAGIRQSMRDPEDDQDLELDYPFGLPPVQSADAPDLPDLGVNVVRVNFGGE